ncbi:MAG: 2-oxoacid ferredoxin oxidoreductase, partial [Desulfobacca sp.]|nr:2-oxoacid ferredoxin oxidoreductase [Desulfobacca sp.]
ALPKDYDPGQWEGAMKTAMEWGDRIPIGLLYQNTRPSFETHFSVLKKGPLIDQELDRKALRMVMEGFL